MNGSRRWTLVFGIFTILFVFSAYVCDDAFITFRTVDNFVRGFGPRWNVAERVQVFTSPLFALVYAAPYFAVHNSSAVPDPGRAYWLAIGLSFAISAAGLGYLLERHRNSPGFWPLFAILMSSQAFVTFTSSGLETPLVYLLIIWLFADWLRRDPATPAGYTWAFTSAGLALLTRLDLALLVGPVVAHLVVVGWRRFGRGLIRPLLVGAAPVAAWHLFSLCYFGFLLPNAYFAKLGVDAPQSLLWWMGQYYLAQSVHQDPVTLAVCAAALAVAWTSRRTFVAGIGVFLYLAYIGSIGGDFLGFRFLTPPFLVSAMILIDRLEAWAPHLPRRWAWGLTGIAVIYSLLMPFSPLRAIREGPRATDVAYYYPASGLARWRPGLTFPFAPFLQVASPADCEQRRAAAPVVAVIGDGLNGFCRGPAAYLIDPHGITDPLMARISVRVTWRFKPAHIVKPMPAGYVESITEGADRIVDPELRVFASQLRTIVAGPLWTADRWRAIWRMNFTRGARFRRTYQTQREVVKG